jgi:hypothetical protein
VITALLPAEMEKTAVPKVFVLTRLLAIRVRALSF